MRDRFQKTLKKNGYFLTSISVHHVGMGSEVSVSADAINELIDLIEMQDIDPKGLD